MSVRTPGTGATTPGRAARVARWALRHPLVAVALIATTGLAAAAITVTYGTTSTLTTGVTAPPIQFVAGDDSAIGNHVTSYAISTNKTYLTAAVKGVPEGTTTIGSLFKLTNVDTAARSVTLSTPQVTNAYVSAYTIGIYNGNTLVDTLTLTAASPGVTFSLPAGATYTGRLTLGLATGAGADNVALTNALTLSFT